MTDRLRNSIKHLTVFTVAALLFAVSARGQESPPEAPAGASELEVADVAAFPSVVARVNQTEITKRDLIERVERIRMERQMPEGELPIEAYRSVLNQAIDMELLYQGSVSNQSAATPEEVDEALSEFKSRFPSEGDFEQGLAARGINLEQARALLRKDLSIQKWIDTRIAARVVVDDQQKRSFYDQNQAEMQQPEQLDLSHILIAVEEGASDAAALEEAKRIRTDIVSGNIDFAEAAAAHSDDPGAKDNRGRMAIARGQTVQAFEDTAFSLEVEEVSEPVKTPFGYHLIKLHEKQPARTVPFEEAAPVIEQFLQQQALQKELEDEVERLRAAAQIEIFI